VSDHATFAADDLCAWYGGSDYRCDEDRRRAVGRARRPLDAAVAAGVAAQNARLAPSVARDRHIAELCSGAAAVVTGQQVGLFLGPLFNLYKAASAIRTAAELRATTGTPVVPVFWLQSEDHDLPEIAVHRTLTADGTPLSLHLPADPGDRRSVADRLLPDEVVNRLGDLRTALAHLPHAAVHLDRLECHYLPGRSWSAAFAAALAELFVDDGLVFLDPRDEAFAAGHRLVHEQALTRAEELALRLETRVEQLRAVNRPSPVHVRSRAPLAFYHADGPSGARHRLEPDGDEYVEVGTGRRHRTSDLLRHLCDQPLSFSTSALLRPILQDTLLPTAAYVGGATEVAYFAQIAPLYEAFSLPMPLIVPRASFRFVDERCQRLLQRWQLRSADCEGSAEDVMRRAATIADDGEKALETLLLHPFARRLDEMAPGLLAVDADLQTAIDKTRATVEMAVARLGSRYDRACRRHNQRLVDDAATLTTFLFPDGQPQERYFGVSAIAARCGDRELVAHVRDTIAPFTAGGCEELGPVHGRQA
jgi:bacillithiol biosynthesis cysteine-adding enzyme BshC